MNKWSSSEKSMLVIKLIEQTELQGRKLNDIAEQQKNTNFQFEIHHLQHLEVFVRLRPFLMDKYHKYFKSVYQFAELILFYF